MSSEFCYRREEVFSYDDLLNTQGFVEKYSDLDTIDSSLEHVFVNTMMIFDKKEYEDKPSLKGKDFFKKLLKSLQVSSPAKASFRTNKSCYYVVGDHVFLTISGPNIDESVKNVVTTVGQNRTNANSLNSSEEIQFEDYTKVNSNARDNAYSSATAMYTDFATKIGTVINAMDQLFTKVPGFSSELIQQLKTFVQNNLNEHVKTSVLLYAVQKLLPSFFTTLLENQNIRQVHVYGWDYGGSAAVMASLIIHKFLELVGQTNCKVSCIPLSPKPFVVKSPFTDHMKSLNSLIDVNNFNYHYVVSDGDMQVKNDMTTKQFREENVTILGEARFKKSTFGTGQFVGHGHFTYSTKVKQGNFVKPTIFENQEVLLSVNPGSIDSGYCKVVVGGAMTKKQLLELAAYFKITGVTKIKKEDLVLNIKKAQKKKMAKSKKLAAKKK